MKVTYIYGLIDPRDNRIRYVGKSDDPRRRLSTHMDWKQQPTSRKSHWIRELLNLRLKPAVVILAEVPAEEWEVHEQAWIKELEHLELVNGTKGGRTGWNKVRPLRVK